jgi:hypothetical protein
MDRAGAWNGSRREELRERAADAPVAGRECVGVGTGG